MTENGSNLAWSTFGRYALLEKIGSGGMAEIFRAKTFGAAGFEKEFAIKLILPTLVDDVEFVEMFINEAKIAVSLYHANVVQVFDLGELDGQYYIAMEFVHGKDLLDVLARCAHMDLKVPLDIVLFITMEYLKGLDFAHRAKNSFGDPLNIIHRDVSPSNVLISYAGDVKIGDFGVAKAAIQRNLTESGTLKGKVGYMSPEQVVGEEIDARSDIFSAGIVFFEALSMSRLFIGNSDLDVMLKVRDADIDDSIAKAGPWPYALEELVRKALTKHREERFQTAGEFYQAIMDFCYQHRIKVTGNDLSNFMRRLFAEEIEAEKNRRLSEEDQKNNGGSPDDSAARKIVSGAQRKSSEKFAPKEANPPPIERPATGDIFDSESYVEEVPDGHPKFRYRDEAGLIFGPMGEKTLVKLLNDRPPEKGDQVSINGGDWMAPSEVEEISEQIPEPKESSGASKSVPVGAAVYRPTKRDVGDEETMREAALSDEGTMLDPPDASESELGDDSSPISVAPPEPNPPATNEEAREVIDKMRSQYASYEGEIANVSFARLLARLHHTGATGRLFVELGDVEKSIFFEAGEPILVDSNREDELLGYFLLSREIISKAQLEEGLTRLSEWGGRLGDALVAIGAIPAHEIFNHLSDQMREKLLEVFTWETGRYGYFENQQPEKHGYPLGIHTYATIVEGCLERIPLENLKSYYHSKMTTPLLFRDNPDVALDDLRLTAKALRVVNQYEPGDSLERLMSRFPGKEHEMVYRVMYLLHQVQVVGMESTEENTFLLK